MMRLESVIELVPEVAPPELADWIARGWVLPAGEPPDYVFAEIDVARVRLIRDLLVEVAVETESVPVVLGLLDQVYALRRGLSAVLAAAEDQPPPVKQALLAALLARNP